MNYLSRDGRSPFSDQTAGQLNSDLDLDILSATSLVYRRHIVQVGVSNATSCCCPTPKDLPPAICVSTPAGNQTHTETPCVSPGPRSHQKQASTLTVVVRPAYPDWILSTAPVRLLTEYDPGFWPRQTGEFVPWMGSRQREGAWTCPRANTYTLAVI